MGKFLWRFKTENMFYVSMITLPLDIITRYPNIGDPKHKLNLSNLFFQSLYMNGSVFPQDIKFKS